MLVERCEVEAERQKTRVDAGTRFLATNEDVLELLLEVLEQESHGVLLTLAKLRTNRALCLGEPQRGEQGTGRRSATSPNGLLTKQRAPHSSKR